MTGPEEWSTSRLSPGSKLTLAAIDLLVVAGPDRGRQCRVTNRKVRVGTGDSAELWLSDPTVSRLHCEIEVRQTGIRIV
ncbi:MAG TPA: FHA domain-containing protein [Polyangiaceae bacterium]|nr:FHA domain-containing protein [Polyangiaceae bacterium]